MARILGAVVVIAANAGGAWTPVGDVTTTMLWMHGHISTFSTIKDLLLPSVVSLAVSLAFMLLTIEVNEMGLNTCNSHTPLLASEEIARRGKLVFGALVFLPVFKSLTGLPPFMGILFGLGVLRILTDVIHYGDLERQNLTVPHAFSRIDIQGALFFLGILLSINSLEAVGILKEIAKYLDAHIHNVELIASVIGVVSAIIDNVPLVAATMGMYDDLSKYPQDSEFWQLIAFCAGTGGTMLITGSAAVVAFMGMEKVHFLWYFRKVYAYLLGSLQHNMTDISVTNLWEFYFFLFLMQVSRFPFIGYAAGVATDLVVHNHLLDELLTNVV